MIVEAGPDDVMAPARSRHSATPMVLRENPTRFGLDGSDCPFAAAHPLCPETGPFRDGRPGSMAATGTRAAAVKVGGVVVRFTVRNRGNGRAITRTLLAEARDAAAAVLAPDNVAAPRAGWAGGYVRVGGHRLTLLASPLTAGPSPCP